MFCGEHKNYQGADLVNYFNYFDRAGQKCRHADNIVARLGSALKLLNEAATVRFEAK